MVAATKGIEIALRADAAAEGDFGDGERGEAQEVVDETLAIMVAEVVAGYARQAADEAGEVTA